MLCCVCFFLCSYVLLSFVFVFVAACCYACWCLVCVRLGEGVVLGCAAVVCWFVACCVWLLFAVLLDVLVF